ncbi:MAG TPA: guanylate kinase [Nevskiaceae bacterium]|nr:guanylate kinase [Nevskiaceae bacterium]
MSEASGPGGLFILSAPSGGGKTSLTRALVPRLAALGQPATISVSYTTRAPRPGETEGVHYHFVSPEQFAAMAEAGAFLEHAQVFGRRYGSGRAATEALRASGQDVIFDIDWQGARQVRQHLPEAVSIFILPPSVAELERRLGARGQDSPEVIRARMEEAHSEIAHCADYDYWVINDQFEAALEALVSIFRAERLRRDRQRLRYAGLVQSLLDST